MPDIGSTPALYAALPTIVVDGRAETGLSDGLIDLLIEETTAGLYRCEATFSNFGSRSDGASYLYFDRDLIDFGKPFLVRASAGDAAGTLFSGKITGVEARFPDTTPPELTVLVEDQLQALRMTRRTRVFEQSSNRDVIERIAQDHGLQSDVDIDDVTMPLLAQVNQSDLAFLRDRARAVDAEVWLADNTLFVQARSRREGESVTLTYREGLFAFQASADLAHQRSSVTVSGWDVDDKVGIAVQSAEAAIQPELNGDLSGTAILAQSLAERHEHIVHHVPFSSEEAQQLANAHYRTAARRFVTGHGTCAGDARLRVGSRVTLRGLGPLFNGAYSITNVRHTFDGMHGLRTQFGVERPGIGRG